MKEVFKRMLELQDSFNERTIPNWKEKNLDWYNALFLESAEQNDSLAWKWWKKGADDMENFKVEVIDNWHFFMSLGLTACDTDFLADKFASTWGQNEYDDDTLQERTQYFIYKVLGVKFDSFKHYWTALEELFAIMKQIGISTSDELYMEYCIKNVLNQFRQDNGYKDGTYIKIWNGDEDNVVAYSIFPDIEGDKFTGLYNKLQEVYNNLKES